MSNTLKAYSENWRSLLGQGIRVSGLVQPFHRLVGEAEVHLYRTDLRDFLVVVEPEDNPGMSVTNAAEYYYPQIASLLGLDWKRVVCIECYPPDLFLNHPDPTFDQVLFEGGFERQLLVATKGNTPLLKAGDVNWRPIGLEMARQLQALGLHMTGLIGRKAWIAPLGEGTEPVLGTIRDYDGRSYYLEGYDWPGRFVDLAENS